MEYYLPGIVPKESIDAHFQMVLPLKWQDEKYKPICIHLAGTGDQVSHPPSRISKTIPFPLNFRFYSLLLFYSFTGEGEIF